MFCVFQFYSLSDKGEFRREFLCLAFTSTDPQKKEKAYMEECHSKGGNQEWEMTPVSL